MQAQKYILIKSSYTLEDAEHTTYGIALADGSALIESVNGLSCDKQRVERLAELCTKLDLSPEHLRRHRRLSRGIKKRLAAPQDCPSDFLLT